VVSPSLTSPPAAAETAIIRPLRKELLRESPDGMQWKAFFVLARDEATGLSCRCVMTILFDCEFEKL
jgi:hypothetical protein